MNWDASLGVKVAATGRLGALTHAKELPRCRGEAWCHALLDPAPREGGPFRLSICTVNIACHKKLLPQERVVLCIQRP